MRGWGLSIRLDIRLITGGVEYSQKLKKKIYYIHMQRQTMSVAMPLTLKEHLACIQIPISPQVPLNLYRAFSSHDHNSVY